MNIATRKDDAIFLQSLLLIFTKLAAFYVYGASTNGNVSSAYGSPCKKSSDCHFNRSTCDEITQKCVCLTRYPVTNYVDSCLPGSGIGEKCFIDEQCAFLVSNSECNDRVCACIGDGKKVRQTDGTYKCIGKRFGDFCEKTSECSFKGSFCAPLKGYSTFACQCQPQLIATNHIDKCGKAVNVSEACTFDEQCELTIFDTKCLNGRCSCRSGGIPTKQSDGSIKCVVVNKFDEVLVDPTMIVVLIVMCLMFIIICVVLHLFSRARWRDNRSIFNTPNPRLANASLMSERKCKFDRRESKNSCKTPPSRRPSLGSLIQTSQTQFDFDGKNLMHRKNYCGGSISSVVQSPTIRITPILPVNQVISEV